PSAVLMIGIAPTMLLVGTALLRPRPAPLQPRPSLLQPMPVLPTPNAAVSAEPPPGRSPGSSMLSSTADTAGSKPSLSGMGATPLEPKLNDNCKGDWKSP